jgi:hypothetical protein
MSPEQKSNLARLAKALLVQEFDVAFDMGDFAFNLTLGVSIDRPAKVKNECSTACCALGHAPLVLVDQPPAEEEDWIVYGERLFGLDGDDAGEVERGEPWEFVFSQEWPDDKRQFAARALHLLRGKDTEVWTLETFPVPHPSSFDHYIIKNHV